MTTRAIIPSAIDASVTRTSTGYTHRCGTDFVPMGYGAYPYPCIAQDKRPDDMIYRCPRCACWFNDHTDTRPAPAPAQVKE